MMTEKQSTNDPRSPRISRRRALGILGGAAAVAAVYPIYQMMLPRSSARTVSALSNTAVRQRLQDELDRLVARPEVHHAIVVAESADGTQRWAGARGQARPGGEPVEQDTPVFLASVTKLYTAAVVMRLAERGGLGLDRPIAAYLPHELIKGLHRRDGHDHTGELTVRHLLGHTSGLADYFTDRPHGGVSLAERLASEGDRAWTIDEVAERVRSDLRPHFAPQPAGAARQKVRYSDTNYQLLGAIVEAVEGAPLREVLEREILVPLGLRHTYLFPHRRGDVVGEPAPIWFGEEPRDLPLALASFGPDGGMVATLGDSISFLRALFNGSLFTSAEGIDMMVERFNRFGLPLDPVALQLPSWPIEYALGIMRFRVPAPLNGFRRMPALLGHTGSTGSWLFFCPELDLFFAGTVNQAAAGALPYRFLPRLLRAIT